MNDSVNQDYVTLLPCVPGKNMTIPKVIVAVMHWVPAQDSYYPGPCSRPMTERRARETQELWAKEKRLEIR